MNRWLSSLFVCGVCTSLWIVFSLYAALFGVDNKGREVFPSPARWINSMHKTTENAGLDRDSIILQLAEHGKWSGEINGARISFARHSGGGPMFRYSVESGEVKSGWRVTAHAAIEAASEALDMLSTRRWLSPLSSAMQLAERPRYKD